VTHAATQTYRSEAVLGDACPQWLNEYSTFHSQQRGGASTKYLVHLVDGGHGGLGDRLNGAIAMLRLAKALNRVLIIKWTQPYAIEEFLQPASAINWSAEGISLQQGVFFNFLDWDRWQDPRLQDRTLNNIQDQFLTITTNMWLNSTCWNCPSISSEWSREAACLWQQLFQPASDVMQMAQDELSRLYPGPPRPFVAVHLRLGGLTGEAGVPGQDRGKTPLHNVFAGHRCAFGLARNSSIDLRQTPALIVTDNHDLRQAVLESQFGGFVSPGGLPVHLDRAGSQSLQAHQRTFVDMVMLGWGQCLVTSHSGFSLHAWLFGGAKPCFVPFRACL
jgi:hypothetical protein